MKTVILVVLVCVSFELANGAPSDKVDCSKACETFGELSPLQDLMSTKKSKFPTTTEELYWRCFEASRAVKIMQKYVRECLPSISQHSFRAHLGARSEFLDTYCRDPSSEKFKAARQATSCVGEHVLAAYKAADEKADDAVRSIFQSDTQDEDSIDRLLCCAALDIKKTIMKITAEKCSKHEKFYLDNLDSNIVGLCSESDKLDCKPIEEPKSDCKPIEEPKTGVIRSAVFDNRD